MRKILYPCCFLLLIIFASSCKKWLDVRPNDKVYVDDVFKNSLGFQKALAGVYNSIGSPSLYGKDMEYGFMDILAGYWMIETFNTHEYYNTNRYEYLMPAARNKIDSIWSGMYSAIRQTNFILDNIENLKTDKDYALIKGEALGLRAFLHFEVFRLFGPSVKQEGLTAKSIPYYTTAGKTPVKLLTAQEVFDLIEKDLQDASVLLKDDPIITNKRTGDANADGTSTLQYDYLLSRRGVRMNYYAVKALLARKSLWQGNLAEAATRAQSVINELQVSDAIRMLKPADIETQSVGADIRFTVENILGLFVNRHNDYARLYFTADNYSAYRSLTPQYSGFLQNLYESGTGSTLDYRLNKWSINTNYFNKFYFFNDPTDVNYARYPQQYEVQLINLPEMYFIIAEANIDTDPAKAVSNINTVRLARNMPALPTNVSNTVAGNNLLDEVRREYIGEGFLFSFYKRRFQNIIRYNGNITASKTVFDLPLPTDETIYNNAN